MAKILEFRRVKQQPKATQVTAAYSDHLEDDINAIMNDYSLTPANRRWLLENMLMDIDEQLENYRRELERAETKLATVVHAAENEIEKAYREFDAYVRGMTDAVERLTGRRQRSRMRDGDADKKGKR